MVTFWTTILGRCSGAGTSIVYQSHRKTHIASQWAFEPWMGRTGRGWRAPGDPVKEKKRVIEQFEKLDIPHSAIYAEGVGAERPDMHTYVNARNIKPLSWYYSAIDQKTQQRLMPDVDVKDLPILNVDNPAKLASRDISYVDFTHPNALEMARRWWKLRLDLGIAGSMVDFGDRVPEDVTFYNGKREMKCIISILMIIIGRMQRCLEKDVATILFCLEGLRRRVLKSG